MNLFHISLVFLRSKLICLYLINKLYKQTISLSDSYRYRYFVTSRKNLRYLFADERSGKNPSKINCAYDRDPLIKFCQLAGAAESEARARVKRSDLETGHKTRE